jgi:predicted transposase/invertase (TIGR01784 family)
MHHIPDGHTPTGPTGSSTPSHRPTLSEEHPLDPRPPDAEQRYPLTSDVVFKGVFGAAGSEPILAALINAVRTDYGFPPVVEVEIENPFNLQQFSADKLSVVDARVRDSTNALFNVEVQSYNHKGLDSRILYYWARSYTDGLGKSEDWYTLKPVYGIAFLDFPFFGEQESRHTCFELRERRSPNLMLSDHLAIHLLELPKYTGFTETQPTETHPPSTALERWVYTLQRAGTGDELMKKIAENDEMIGEAERRYRAFVEDPAARRAALERDVWIRDRGQMIRDAREEGFEQGRKEQACDTAMRLIARGDDDDTISSITGLSAEELKALRDETMQP